MGVDDHRGFIFARFQPLPVDHRMSSRGDDLARIKPQSAQLRRNPFGRMLNVSPVGGIGADRRNPQEVKELLQVSLPIRMRVIDGLSDVSDRHRFLRMGARNKGVRQARFGLPALKRLKRTTGSPCVSFRSFSTRPREDFIELVQGVLIQRDFCGAHSAFKLFHIARADDGRRDDRVMQQPG